MRTIDRLRISAAAEVNPRDATLLPAEAQAGPRIRAYAAPRSGAGAGGCEAPDLALFEVLYSGPSLRTQPRRPRAAAPSPLVRA